MKIFICAKFYDDARNKESVQKLIVELFERGHYPVCAMEDLSRWGEYTPGNNELVQWTLGAIDTCDCVVVVSDDLGGVTMGIEVGYAHAKNKPVIVTAHTPLPVMLREIAIGQLLII